MPAAGSLKKVININDLRTLAQRRLPRGIFDYLDGGAEAEVTLRGNTRVFDEVMFRPRQAVAVVQCQLRTKILGTDIAFPTILAPVGYSRMMHPHGEVAAAAAAGAAGIPYTLSTMSGHKLENVRKASASPVWYQLYLVGGRTVAEAALERARSAGFSALVVTIDTPVAGMRERDPRNGLKDMMGGSLASKIPHLPQFLARPRWLTRFLLDGGSPKLENIVIPGQGPMPLVDVVAALADAVITWDDLQWVRKAWPGPIIIKGVLTADDARRSAEEGAAAIVVSNHGGRQLDSVSPTLQALPEIVAAVGNKLEVLLDGGIRRGSDIVKALCLGARAVLIGRAYAYGLAAAGQPGVTTALNILRADMERTLRLLGCPGVTALDSSYVQVPRNW